MERAESEVHRAEDRAREESAERRGQREKSAQSRGPSESEQRECREQRTAREKGKEERLSAEERSAEEGAERLCCTETGEERGAEGSAEDGESVKKEKHDRLRSGSGEGGAFASAFAVRVDFVSATYRGCAASLARMMWARRCVVNRNHLPALDLHLRTTFLL